MAQLLNKVKSVRCLGGYRVKVVFSDGFIGEVDLGPELLSHKGRLAKELHDPAEFQRVTVKNGTVAWPNSYDICPDVLRYWCKEGRVCPNEEMEPEFTTRTK